MLEARKLSAQVQQELGGRAWSALFVSIWLATLTVIASLWIGANFEAPAPDKTQEKLTEAHAQVLEVVARLSTAVSADQEINLELFEQLSSLQAPLLEFGQKAAAGLRLAPDTKDAQNWPGKVNVMLDDLKILSESKEMLMSYASLRDALFGLYRPKGPVNPKQFAEGTPAKALYAAVLKWHQLGLPADAPAKASLPFTWDQLAKSKTHWREISAQLDALELDAKQIQDVGKAKVAKDMLAFLSKNDVMQSLRTADDTWARVILVQERLHSAVNQLPPEPKAILASPPFHWSRLAFPGSVSEGMMTCAGLMVLGLLTAAAGHLTRRRQLGVLSKQWITVTQQLEASVRAVDAPLTQSIARIEALAAEFSLVTDKLKYMQQAITSPAEAPPKSMEEQAWGAATRMQAELESDLNLLREKLLNIHLQFCSGQTHENLVYDLAFTTEAVQTVFVTARDLGRSVALLKDSLQQAEAQGDGQDIEQLLSQVNNLKASAKRIAMNLQELSGRLQLAVGDVPEGRRFELEGSENEVGRLRVNQPI